jgi:hypothetical protein
MDSEYEVFNEQVRAFNEQVRTFQACVDEFNTSAGKLVSLTWDMPVKFYPFGGLVVIWTSLGMFFLDRNDPRICGYHGA